MPRAKFSHVKLADPELFVIKVSGHLGVKERASVQELLQKCDERQKSKVIFEFSELESLGGGVAKLLGDFVGERNQLGFRPAFVGCSDTVQNFLSARCDGGVPSFFSSLEESSEYFANAPTPAPAANPSRHEPLAASEEEIVWSPEADAVDQEERAASESFEESLIHDWVEFDAGAGGGEPAPPATPPDPSSKLRIREVDRPVPAARYLSLAEAEQAFGAAQDLAGMKGAVAALLYGVDLADSCHLMTRKGKKLEEVGYKEHSLNLSGAIAMRLLKANTPVPMDDLDADEATPSEIQLLTELNCQMAVPIIVGEKLEGALFLRKEHAGNEYGPSEVLALDLLGRKIAHALAIGGEELSGRTRTKGSGSKSEDRDLNRKIHQQKALFTIGKEFNSTRDEDHLVNLVLLTTIAQVGVGSVAWFEMVGDRLVPRKQRGPEEISLSEIALEDPQLMGGVNHPLQLDPENVPKGLEKVMGCLREYGFDLVAPLTGKNKMYGILALGPRLSGGRAEGVDHEFLEILLNQAGVALENARLIRDLHDRNLGVAQTFVNLIEKRSGPGARASTELISHYVGKVATKINYPSDQIRDLVYGTVLRDIGMIEISDLVLKSPRSLSPEEWQLIKQHPLTGVNILSAMEFSQTITDVVLYHHERFNGEGYPHGLRGAAIPLSARIVSVVESFVAMTRDLPYRAALSRGEALEVIRENWGMRYDAEVLQAFLEIIEEEGEVEPVTNILVGAH